MNVGTLVCSTIIAGMCVMGGMAESSTPLIANDGTSVGAVRVWNTAERLYVECVPATLWYMRAMKAHAAATLEGIPQKNGNPQQGKFAASIDSDPWRAEFSLGSAKPGDTLCIAAHVSAQCDGGYLPGNTSADITNLPVTVSYLHWYDMYFDGVFPGGYITVAVTGEFLSVRFTAEWSCELVDTHVYASKTPPGALAMDQLPYNHAFSEVSSPYEDTFLIPLADLGAAVGDSVYVAAGANMALPAFTNPDGSVEYCYGTGWANADATGTNGMAYGAVVPDVGGGGEYIPPGQAGIWAGDKDFPGKNPATYFTYTIE
ncbi:hypothetical protein GX586_11020 [bacterium]|nr:hypothetical protein [bacterium]